MLRLTEPLVPVMLRVALVLGLGVGVGVGGGGLPPPPHESIPPRSRTATTIGKACLGLRVAPISNPARIAAKAIGQPRKPLGVTPALVVLVTVTVKGTLVELAVKFRGLPPFTVQVEPPGAPVQVKVTEPLK